LQLGYAAEDGISLSLGIAEYVFNRGSTLVSLAPRRKNEENVSKTTNFIKFSLYCQNERKTV